MGGHADRPLEVVFLGHSAEASGAEIALTRLAGELVARGGTVVRVVLLAHGPIIDELARRGVTVDAPGAGHVPAGSSARVGGGLRGRARGAAELVTEGVRLGRRLRRDRPDVLVAETLKALFVGAVASRIAGLPLVWHAHDRLTDEYLGRTTATVVRTVARRVVDGYVANSASTLDTLPTRGRPAAVVHPGVEPGASLPREPQRPAGECEVVMVGRIDHWKGQRVLLDAVRRMAHPPRRLELVGGALFGREALEAELRAEAASLPGSVEVVFSGHVPDPAPRMAAADVLVHCSTLPEPFGQVVVEGMQQGCAVVAAGAGGPLEIVDDGEDGLLHRPGDPDHLAECLDRLVRDPRLRATLAAAGQARAREFELPEQAGRMLDLLRRVADVEPHRARRRG